MALEYKGKAAFPLRLPKTTSERVKVMAAAEGISVNHFIMLAVTEKITQFDGKTGINGQTGVEPVETPSLEVVSLEAE
jgi:HicB family